MAYYERSYYREGESRSFFPAPGGRSVVLWLIIANVAVLFIDGFAARVQHGVSGLQAGGVLTDWGAFSFTQAVAYGQVWRFFSYQFLHAGIGHLFWNMLGLFFFGPMVEQFLGSRRFLAYYLLCGASGALLYLLLLSFGFLAGSQSAGRVPFLLVGHPDSPLVGASGAIFGVLVACLRIAPDMRVLLFFILPVPMRVVVWLVLLLNLYAAMVSTSAGGEAAHLGGAILGAVLIRKISWLGFADSGLWGWFGPARWREKMRQNSEKKRRERMAASEKEVDRILEKVHREGLASLTSREKKTLQQATENERSR